MRAITSRGNWSRVAAPPSPPCCIACIMLGDEDRVPVGSTESSVRVGCAGRVNGLPMYLGAEQGMGAAGLKAPLLGLTDSDWLVW